MVAIEVDGSRLGLTFSSCHILQGHAKCGRLHGHNYSVSVRIEGDTPGGMLVDFGPLKDAIRSICRELDHRMLVPESLAKTSDGRVDIDAGGKLYSIPAEDAVLLPIATTTTEDLSALVLAKLLERHPMPPFATKVAVRVEEMGGQGAWSERSLR